MLSYLTERISGWKKLKKIAAIMIQYKQKQLNIIRQKRQCHNIEDHTSEESYQDISMLQKEETEIMKLSKCVKLGIFGKRQKQSMLEKGCQEQAVFIN